MAGTAARGDAGRHRQHAALRAVLGERVQVRGDGGFQRRQVTLFARGDVAQAVQHQQDDFGFGLEGEFGVERVEIHDQMPLAKIIERLAVASVVHNAENAAESSTGL